jgi:hypothetical protein
MRVQLNLDEVLEDWVMLAAVADGLMESNDNCGIWFLFASLIAR